MKTPPYSNAGSTVRESELVGGHTPAFWAAKARPCPKCGAEPGSLCRTAAGKPAYLLHGARYARQAGEQS